MPARSDYRLVLRGRNLLRDGNPILYLISSAKGFLCQVFFDKQAFIITIPG